MPHVLDKSQDMYRTAHNIGACVDEHSAYMLKILCDWFGTVTETPGRKWRAKVTSSNLKPVRQHCRSERDSLGPVAPWWCHREEQLLMLPNAINFIAV